MIACTERHKRATEREAKRRKVDECIKVDKQSSDNAGESDDVIVKDAEMQMEVTVSCIENWKMKWLG